MIKLSHAYKSYFGSVYALKDVTFEIEKGEFVYLTGPSGSGKTTLFKLISAFDRATSGSVEVCNIDITHLLSNDVPLFRRKIGVVYQDFRLIKTRTVFENVALPLEVRNERQSYIQKRTHEILESVGLFHKKDCFPEQLSGGEQQRVAIARALVHHPGVLIADEPTGNLDPQLTEEVMDLLEKANSQGTTVFVATHDHELVKRRAKRVIKLNLGQVEV